MRVLVATTAGEGHFGPVVPFADALRSAGHDVVVTAPSSFAPVVGRSGFRFEPFADAAPEELQAVFATLGGLTNTEGNGVVVREVFGRIAPLAALPGLDSFARQWRPDLILRESSEFASYLVAEELGVPHVEVAVGLADFHDAALAVVDEPLTALGAEPGLARLRAAVRITLVPESLDGPGVRGAGAVHRFRDGRDGGPVDPLPDWWAGSTEPLVYVTFGTVAASLGLFPGLYRDVVAALAELAATILLTIGEAGDPDALGPLPDSVHVERFWPQKAVMANASAMIGHGGFGTTLTGLAAGVPMVVLPLFADQPHNARRVHATGAGIALEGGPAAVGELHDAVQRVLTEASYRAEARRVAHEVERLAPASEAVSLLEGLAGRP